MRPGKSGPFQSAAAGISALVLTMGYANAHVTLAEPQAVPGAQYMAHFRVGHGCEGSPTVALKIELPPEVSAVTPQPQPGWTISTEREGSRIKAVTWTGGILPPDQHGVFAIAMTLPGREGQLLFPARQTCQTGEEYWSEPPPAAGKAKYPAPLLTVGTAASTPASAAVTDGWFRALPSSVPSGGYFTLRNTGTKPLTLTDVETPACGMVMMHKSSNGGMAHVMSLDVMAGETVTFAPGGYHLMCMDTKPALKPGAQVPVTFHFAGNQNITTTFDVRSATGK